MHPLDKIINSPEFAAAARRYTVLALPTFGLSQAQATDFDAWRRGAFLHDPEINAAWSKRYANWTALPRSSTDRLHRAARP